MADKRQRFTTYSLPDVHFVFNHPAVGSFTFTEENAGGGRIQVAHTGDMSSHTNTANGYTVVNILKSHNGSVAIEVGQNSPADMFMRKYVSYIESAPTNAAALATLTLFDTASGITINGSGVTLQKRPDRAYDQTSGNLTYQFLVADMTESN